MRSLQADSRTGGGFAHRRQVTATAQCANECLRLVISTPMATGRIALGVLVMEGGTVLSMVWAAGNHDPLAFPAPERFDPDRQGARPLMFGTGQHACLGHAIIRATLVQLLDVLEAFAPEAGTPPARWSPFAKDHLPALDIRFEG